MPIDLPAGYPSLVIRKSAFERTGLTRAGLDERLGLTSDEFRIEGELLVVGPILDEDALPTLIEEFEEAGLAYFDDFFEFTGNWPEWIRVFAMAQRTH